MAIPLALGHQGSVRHARACTRLVPQLDQGLGWSFCCCWTLSGPPDSHNEVLAVRKSALLTSKRPFRGCGRPAIHLSPFTPWAGGVPHFARQGSIGVSRDPGPFCLKGYRLPTPQKRSKTGPGRPPRCRRWVAGCSGRPEGGVGRSGCGRAGRSVVGRS